MLLLVVVVSYLTTLATVRRLDVVQNKCLRVWVQIDFFSLNFSTVLCLHQEKLKLSNRWERKDRILKNIRWCYLLLTTQDQSYLLFMPPPRQPVNSRTLTYTSLRQHGAYEECGATPLAVRLHALCNTIGIDLFDVDMLVQGRKCTVGTTKVFDTGQMVAL